MNRQEFIDKLNTLKDHCKKQEGETSILMSCLIDLASAFCAIADDQYKKSQLIYLAYWKKLFNGQTFESDVSGFENQFSRPIAFQVPDNLSTNSLLLLIAKTATDCLEELRKARQITESISLPDLLQYIPDLSKSVAEKKSKEEKNDSDIPF
jgi:hypothetical protein